MNKIKTLIISILLINLYSCGGGSETPTVDEIPPIISLIGPQSISIQVGSTYIDEGATANDNVDGFIEVNTTSNLDTSIIGSYSINYEAIDAAGNTAQITREVEVEAAQINTAAFEGRWVSDCIVGSENTFKVEMELTDLANRGSMVIKGYRDECITPDYQASLDISLSYPGSHTSSVCSNAVKVNGSVNYPISVLVDGQTEPLEIPNELFLNSIGFNEEDFLVAFDLMCTNDLGTILYGGLVTEENNGSIDSKRPINIDTDGFWSKQ